MKKVRLITVRSEIAAGTRGAGMGVDAMIIASLGDDSKYFAEHESVSVDDVNNILFTNNEFTHAKHIDGVLTMLERVSKTTDAVMEAGEFPVILAGDHSTAAGSIIGIKKAFPEKRIGAIWIDAHADFHSPFTTPSGNMHGMTLAMVTNEDNLGEAVNEPKDKTKDYWERIKHVGLEGPKLNHEDIVFIAVRDTEGPEDVIMKQHGIKNFNIEEVRAKGVKNVAQEALNQLKACDMIYVSFDVDSMDSSISMGTGTPVANGLSVEEAKTLNTELVKADKVVAWEIVEVNPTLDKENTMAKNAFAILRATTETVEARLKDSKVEKV